MPSTTEPQARFMAACAHGAGYSSCPSEKVSHDFNQADKGSALLSHAMQHKHAAGGAISPLASLVGNPMTMRSTQPRLGQPLGSAGRMRMPHVPLADTMHNIDQHMAGARAKLPKLQARTGGHMKRFDEGGPVQQPVAQPAAQPDPPQMSPEMRKALLKAWFTQHAPVLNGQTLTPDPNQPQHFDEGGRATGQSSPGTPGVGGAVKDALAALKDYLIDRPRREIQAARTARENAIIDDTGSAPQGGQQANDYAAGGAVPGLSESAKGAVKAALMHLTNKDASSAAATLHASPEAMQHPVVRLAAHALRTGAGVAPATQGLTGMAGQGP